MTLSGVMPDMSERLQQLQKLSWPPILKAQRTDQLPGGLLLLRGQPQG